MLVHQIHTSEGSASDTVVLNNRTIVRASASGTVSSGILLSNNGILFLYQANGGVSQVIGEWLVVGTASDFYVQRTVIDGTLEIDEGAGFLQLNVGRDYVNEQEFEGLKSTTVFFEIASDASGAPIVATATMTFTSIKNEK